MKRNLDLAMCVAAVCAVANFVSPRTVEAQAPTGPPGMENGLTYFQTRCMSCHRENDSAKAPGARRIRPMTPEQIYAEVSKPSRPEHDQSLTDSQNAAWLSGQ